MNTHDIFDFLSKKVGGGQFLCGPHRAEKWGDASPPPSPTDLRPCLLRAMNASGAGRHGWVPMNSANLHGGGDGGVCVCVCVCVRACVCARTLACVRACVMCLQYTIIKFDPG